MEALSPKVMLEQVQGLPRDLCELTEPVAQQVRDVLGAEKWGQIGKVYLVGDGDSHHAACATELAYESIAGVSCEPLSALRFVSYGADAMRLDGQQRILVIATSASGETERVLEVIERAREHGASTLAITGTPGSAVTRIADQFIVVALGHQTRSPGIRTYQASLLGMLLCAIRLGEARGAHPAAQSRAMHREITALASFIHTTNQLAGDRCRVLADRIADAPAMVMVGSGPNHGTAMFGAAKMIEAAGLIAVGQDIEEWWHVERFAYPVDMPVVVISPPGRSHQRAGAMAAKAAALGRRVIAVTDPDDAEVARHAEVVLPVCGRVREEFSPLLYHLFASHLACWVALCLGRRPFQR
ncbi:MAG: SIS domain-containing protein [Egibacteraceae bacterium]